MSSRLTNRPELKRLHSILTQQHSQNGSNSSSYYGTLSRPSSLTLSDSELLNHLVNKTKKTSNYLHQNDTEMVEEIQRRKNGLLLKLASEVSLKSIKPSLKLLNHFVEV